MKRLIYLALLIAIPCFGQAVRYNGNAYSVNASSPQPGALYPVLASASATIQICTYSTTETCPSLATTYTDATGATPCDVTAQLTPSNSGACTAVVEASGIWGAWVHAGNYQYTITTPAGTSGPYNFTAGGSGGSSIPYPSGSGVPIVISGTSWGTTKPLAGAGAGVVTGPTSGVVVSDLLSFATTTGQVQDTGMLSTYVPYITVFPLTAGHVLLGTGVNGIAPDAGCVGGMGAMTCTTFNGVPLTATGSSSLFLTQAGTYAAAGSGSGTVSGQASGVVGLGTGATTTGAQSHINENTSGVTNVTQTLAAPTLIGGTPSSGALAALPTGAHGIANDESSTAGVPAAGVDYLRADAAAHCYKESVNGGAETCIGAGGSSPLTTKGDLYGFDTANNRIPVGSNGQVLTADSTQALGVKWAAVSGSGNTTSTSLTTNTLPKANGANSIIDSSVSDNGTTVTTAEPMQAAGLSLTGSYAGYTDYVQGPTPPTQPANSARWYSASSGVTSWACIWPTSAPTSGNTLLSCPNGGGQATWVSPTANPCGTTVTTLSSPAASISLTIPGGCTNVSFNFSGNVSAGSSVILEVNLNSDFTAGDYNWQLLYGAGTSAGALASTGSPTYIAPIGGNLPSASSSSAVTNCTINNYTGTLYQKYVVCTGGTDFVSTFVTGKWIATPAAVTNITLTPASSTFATGTQVTVTLQ